MTLYEAAELIAERAKSGDDRSAYARAQGFAEWIPLVLLIAKVVADVLRDCQSPDRIVPLAYHRPREAARIVRVAARARVAETYSFVGRILWRGRIERLADEITQATIDESLIADPATIRELHTAALSA